VTQDRAPQTETSALDLDDVAQFYADLFDWKIQLDPTLNYYRLEAEAGPGAILTVKAGARPGYLEYKAEPAMLYLGGDGCAGAPGEAAADEQWLLVPRRRDRR
jgi:predicted enzyme related to lactoylglutathione lyase